MSKHVYFELDDSHEAGSIEAFRPMFEARMFESKEAESVTKQNWYVSEEPLSGTHYPTLATPVPNSAEDILPDRSPTFLVATASPNLFIRTTVTAPLAPGPFINIVDLNYFHSICDAKGVWLTPPLPNGLRLAIKQYWQKLDQERIVGPQPFTYSHTHKAGMSVATENSLSVELGVQVSGLSAKMTDTFKQTVTITEEDDITKTYQFSAAEGIIYIWALWQYVECYSIVDSANNEVNYSGRCDRDGATVIAAFDNYLFPNPTSTFSASLTKFSAKTGKQLKDHRGGWVSSG